MDVTHAYCHNAVLHHNDLDDVSLFIERPFVLKRLCLSLYARSNHIIYTKSDKHLTYKHSARKSSIGFYPSKAQFFYLLDYITF